MTPGERELVVELLELSHGYAILGSIIPFKTACAELGLVATPIAREAAEVIDRARVEMKLAEKPQREQYRDAIGLALERVIAGDWL